MAVYPIGTIVNCNRCDKQFPLNHERKGAQLHTTAARLTEFETCPHCTHHDTHWVYAKNNPDRFELQWTLALLEFTFENSAQATYAQKYLSARNVFLKRRSTEIILIASDAIDAEAVLHLLTLRKHKYSLPCPV